MKVLFDTNIIINREDNKEIEKNLQKLMQLLHQEDYSIYVHPASIKDINNDMDEKRKKITLSKLKTYPSLESPPDYKGDVSFIEQIPNYANLNPHDLIDLELFYALYRHAVSFLVTEDKKIHSWSRIFGLEHCYTIEDALGIFVELTKKPQEISKPIPIKCLLLSNIKLEDSFFDDLREDYDREKFENWFKKKAEEGRKAYIYLNKDGSLGAFLMLKEEIDEVIKSKPHPIHKKKILKICTLKTNKWGINIGELFLGIAFKYAFKNNFEEIYLTHFIKRDSEYLVPLIEKFGFVKSSNYLEHDHTDEKESIFFKKLKTSDYNSIDEIRVKYFPSFYDGNEIRKFIVPIKPKWHDRLFYDERKQSFLGEYLGEFCIEGNTIQKAYLCRSKCKQMREGDILIFYHSNKDQRVTSICTVDKVYQNINSVSEASLLVGKRTVYNLQEIEELITKGPLTIILFKYHFPLPIQLTYNDLIRKNILRGCPQSVMQLEKEKYIKLKRETKIPSEFTHWDE